MTLLQIGTETDRKILPQKANSPNLQGNTHYLQNIMQETSLSVELVAKDESAKAAEACHDHRTHHCGINSDCNLAQKNMSKANRKFVYISVNIVAFPLATLKNHQNRSTQQIYQHAIRQSDDSSHLVPDASSDYVGVFYPRKCRIACKRAHLKKQLRWLGSHWHNCHKPIHAPLRRARLFGMRLLFSPSCHPRAPARRAKRT